MTRPETAIVEEEAETSPLDLGARFICEDFGVIYQPGLDDVWET